MMDEKCLGQRTPGSENHDISLTSLTPGSRASSLVSASSNHGVGGAVGAGRGRQGQRVRRLRSLLSLGKLELA